MRVMKKIKEEKKKRKKKKRRKKKINQALSYHGPSVLITF